MEETQYVDFVRSRITQLRLQRNISEHKMSLDLDKSGSYIRSITNGTALPSLKELFHIITYFDMTPVEFFEPPYGKLCERLRCLGEGDLQKVETFLDLIAK